MTTRKALTHLTLAAIGGLLLTSCEDQDSKANEALAQTISEARDAYTAAASENSSVELDMVAGTLATAGSSPAAALLEASARLDVANLHLTEADQLEQQNRALRGTIRVMARAAASLHAIATANSGFDPSESEGLLATALAAMQGQLAQSDQTIATLQEPVNTLTAQNNADGEEATRLQAEARELRDRAFSAGDLLGHPLVTQAVDRDRQADTLEAAIMQREIELIELGSQLNWARVQKEQIETQISKTREAQVDLAGAGQAFKDTARNVRSTLSQIQSEMTAALSMLSENQNRLSTLYSECTGGLETAAGRADRSNGDSGRVLKARILQTTGQMNRTNAIGLADQADLLQHLASIGDAAGGSGYGARASSTSTAADQASQAAQAAFQQALDALPSSNPNAKLRASLSEAAGG